MYSKYFKQNENTFISFLVLNVCEWQHIWNFEFMLSITKKNLFNLNVK